MARKSPHKADILNPPPVLVAEIAQHKSRKSPPKKKTAPNQPPKSDVANAVHRMLRARQRAADDENGRPEIVAGMAAMERVAAVHLDTRYRHWTPGRRAQKAGVTLAEWRSIMADPMLFPALEEAWRHLLLGAVAGALHGMIETSVLIGREGSGDRMTLLRMAGLLGTTMEDRKTGRAPAMSLTPQADISHRLQQARANARALPAPSSTEQPSSARVQTIEADYVEEPDDTTAGDTAEFV